jgi:hypothetical protein
VEFKRREVYACVHVAGRERGKIFDIKCRLSLNTRHGCMSYLLDGAYNDPRREIAGKEGCSEEGN